MYTPTIHFTPIPDERKQHNTIESNRIMDRLFVFRILEEKNVRKKCSTSQINATHIFYYLEVSHLSLRNNATTKNIHLFEIIFHIKY